MELTREGIPILEKVRPLMGRMPVRAIGLVAAVAIAYHYSLETLVRGLSLQTPLAYLALVPLIALLVAAVNFRIQPVLRPINDRQVDWIIGLLLIGIAGCISFLLPSAYSTDFWLHRLDMIGLPFFAAGMIALMWGVRRLWALRWAVAFLLLAWPDPYVSLLASAIGTSTDIALSAVTVSMQIVPIADSLGNGTFLVHNSGGDFSLSVASACSGINSLVGFVIVGAAFNTVFRGNVLRRLLWLAAGLILVGALNVLRIDLIFLTGWALGESVAIDILHPVAGIVVFGLGALGMLAIAPLFGLRIPEPPVTAQASAAASTAAAAATTSDDAASSQTPVPAPRRPEKKHRGGAAAIAVGLGLAVVLAVPDASFARYDSLLTAFGSPTLGAIDPAQVQLTGWAGQDPTTNDQATSYFGDNATWERIAFAATDVTTGPDAVYLDVIRTDDAGTLGAYGVEACYNFHGFSQVSLQTLDVGAGVDAKMASYRAPNGGTDWTLLWWEWPFDAGGQTRFERLVLLAPIGSGDGSGAATTDAQFQTAQTSLTSLARSIVSQSMSQPAPTVDPGA